MASRSVERFRRALVAAGLADTVTELTIHARTAREAADALDCAVGQIVKSLVFADPSGAPLLVLAAGSVRVDEDRVGQLHGAPVTLADARVVRATAGYAIGGVPPFGHDHPMPALIDSTLTRYPVVWAAAGTPRHVFSIAPESLARVTGGQWSDVAVSTE